jgi:ADP-dependent NAD(P)H-hydrate dehydratase / NAD(P)H-hydrate epimerase
MKLYTAEAMQEADRRTIAERGVPGLTLMENAGRGCALLIHERYGTAPSPKAVIVAGKGNNGGDGYVIARLLAEQGWRVMTLVLGHGEEISGDARSNLERLPPDSIRFCPEGIAAWSEELAQATIIVDALFGTGLSREISGPTAWTVNLINAAGRPVVAVDIPSGIHGTTGKILGTAIRAELTVTFDGAKPGHVLYPGTEYVGDLQVVDIGIPESFLARPHGYEFIDAAAAAALIRPRRRTAHKGSCGHLLIIAGSRGKTGAAALAANSAVRAGSGLVTLAVPASLHDILELKTTEAMTVPLDDERRGYLTSLALTDIQALLPGKNALALGPGLSLDRETATLVHRLLLEVKLPLVLDADAINAIAEQPELLRKASSHPVILTPHPGEMSRFMGISVAQIEADRIAAAHEAAVRHGVHIILKGARSISAAPDGRIAINGSGNPGMASGGMGDVLTGIVASLLGQGYPPFDACKLGVFLHSTAADMVAADKGEIGLTATDVLEQLPYAYKFLVTGR